MKKGTSQNTISRQVEIDACVNLMVDAFKQNSDELKSILIKAAEETLKTHRGMNLYQYLPISSIQSRVGNVESVVENLKRDMTAYGGFLELLKEGNWNQASATNYPSFKTLLIPKLLEGLFEYQANKLLQGQIAALEVIKDKRNHDIIKLDTQVKQYPKNKTLQEKLQQLKLELKTSIELISKAKTFSDLGLRNSQGGQYLVMTATEVNDLLEKVEGKSDNAYMSHKMFQESYQQLKAVYGANNLYDTLVYNHLERLQPLAETITMQVQEKMPTPVNLDSDQASKNEALNCDSPFLKAQLDKAAQSSTQSKVNEPSNLG